MTARRWILLIALACGGLILAFQQGWLDRRPAAPTPSAESAPTRVLEVSVVSPRLGNLSAERVTSVVIEPARESRIAAGTSGRVSAVFKREDEAVTRGEVVAELDTSALLLRRQNLELAISSAEVALRDAQLGNEGARTQAEAALTTARANLELARRRHAEGLELSQVGAVSPVELAQLEAELSQARQNFDVAQGEVARLSQADEGSLELLRLQRDRAANDLAQLNRELGEAVIRAPFTGEITELHAAEGEFVEAGAPVATVMSSNELLARFSVPPAVASELEAAGSVPLRYGGAEHQARILSRSSVDVETQLVEITAALEDGAPIPSGVVIQLPYEAELATGLLLPSDALERDTEGVSVYSLDGGRVLRLPVEVTAEAGGRAVIEGLPIDAQVVAPLPEGIRDRARVLVRE